MNGKNQLVNIMPEMKTGEELLDCLRKHPDYAPDIQEKSSMERLIALSDIYNVYIPSQMSVEIYHKLYMGLLRALQKKETIQAVCQGYENEKCIRSGQYRGIIGGSDSFTVIGTSGIGKSSAVFQAINLITTKKVLEIEEPYSLIAPCIIVQCPFDSSVKGLLLEILRKVDEVLDSKYYVNALKARASVDMLIGSVSQVALNHIGLLVVDEIQNVVNSRNGKSLVGMLTQLINNSGISICMVGTPESIPFFEQAMQLARRSLGLQYETMKFDEEFCRICKELFTYQYTRKAIELSEGIMEWLFEHCSGNISVLVSLIHDAQEIAILNGYDVLDMSMLEVAYQKRLSMLHEYLEPSIQRKKQSSDSRKKVLVSNKKMEERESDTKESTDCDTLAGFVKKAKQEKIDIVQIFREHFEVEEVAI